MMNRIKRFSALLSLILVLAVTLLPIFSVTSMAAAPAHREHVDVDGDGVCDIKDCDVFNCPKHTDVDGDGYCDIEMCGICISHKDDDSNGVCDKAGCGACTSHKDADANGVCDTEGCSVEVIATSTIGTPKWNTNLIEALKMMGLGMVGIFIVTGIIIIVIYVLNRVTNTEGKGDKN